MIPTRHQLARADQIAPRVAMVAGFANLATCDPGYSFMWGERGDDGCAPHICALKVGGKKIPVLDPRALQAVMLALPKADFYAAIDAARAAWEQSDAYGVEPFLRWLLIPAGMLAIYEALAEQYESGGFAAERGEGAKP